MTFLCALDAIPERGARGFTVGTTELFLLKYDGIVYAYRNSCPHRGVELNWRPDEFFDRDGEWLQCAMHGALFEPQTGTCVAGPCRGSRLESLSIRSDASGIYLDR